jgi:CheY-like chemotaxis protein
MSGRSKRKTGVFISYNHEDSYIASTLAEQLKESGFVPWVDSGKLVGGEEWRRAIDTALDNTGVLLVILTPQAVASEWVSYEIREARKKNCVIIPLMFRMCELPEEISMLHFIDFRKDAAKAQKELIRALITILVHSDRDDRIDETLEEETQPNIARPIPMPPKKGKNGKLLALVIEDQKSNQDILCELLLSTGLDVHIASTRNEASKMIQSDARYAFVTLDMQLGQDDEGGQDGIYLLDQLRRFQGDVPVVIITRLPFDKVRTSEFFANGGIKHMLDKPFKQDVLLGLVQKYVFEPLNNTQTD